YDAWLHDAGRQAPAGYSRSQLSWWALAAAPLQPPSESVPEWQPASVLLESQGLAILRHGDAYASLECGPAIGGHGHPDRLHLTLHQGGVHWLPDQGTGSYVQPSLAWYRSALAHNAPLLDGANAGGDAWCEAFEAADKWAWCRARAGEVRRTIILAPTHVLDLLELEAGQARRLELPWHWQGELTLESPGRWERAQLEHPFVSEVERDASETEATEPRTFRIRAQPTRQTLRVLSLTPGAELIRAVAPGLPVDPAPRPFLLFRADGAMLRWLSVLDFAADDSAESVTGIGMEHDVVELTTSNQTIRYHVSSGGLRIERGNEHVTLAGLRPAPPRYQPIFGEHPIFESVALAPRLAEPPALDGTLEGFVLSAPLELNSEDQYRRSEALYEPEIFSARAWLNWDGQALYLAVAVSKPELVFRAPDAPPLLLDNEPEDIHSDGLQLYWQAGTEERAFLVVPRPDGGLQARSIIPSDAKVTGRWRQTSEGYLVTLRLEDPVIPLLGPGAQFRFDLLVNEMQPGRLRRAGQLVWSGGGGWIYLRGDRHDLLQAGVLELG
ncbi:MAG TPA: heparinase II/III family protein, partial [Gemmatimonadales bacterium]|nr:heparinase II/III family protein [Gemmatimonadales bacterium]